ncbi:hypothetical protein [Lentilactobacillus sp. Marseille-Q4993]|uniref:hypothetical protein n=1 Tax=Lentilactobacillus sp. Marseille-Q4993 TaxID=3039492 RepID=UPI0024BC423D|nr:hypothetical protein [Lentilactobacillus sp. Marseille-Q4993]
MKKFYLVIVAVAFSFLMFATTQQVSAATYHSGTPKILRGHWRSAKKTSLGHGIMNVHKTKVYLHSRLAPDPEGMMHAKYKRTSKGHYKLIGRNYANAPVGGSIISIRVKVYSHHKIYVKGQSMKGVYYK